MDTEVPTKPDFGRLEMQASAVFTPAVPIATENLFAGRMAQVLKLVDAINQRGQHAVLYGERGVGKTSLANVIGEKWQGTGYILAPRIGCSSADTWPDIWARALREINLTVVDPRAGFRNDAATSLIDAASSLPEGFGLDEVRASLTSIGRQAVLVLIFDEFDTLNEETRKRMAEAVKQFSDYVIPVTLILVGVADSVRDLLDDHASVERALVQVQMPRMSDEELGIIIHNGAAVLGMSWDTSAATRVVDLSRGLPHYTHLLGLYATRAALRGERLKVQYGDVAGAIGTALDNSQQSIKDAYIAATMSSQKNHLFREVLLACALAQTNEVGFFTASAVRDPLTDIMGKPYEIPSFVRHLNEFCNEKRGRILERIGEARSHRFRFRNPLMQPFIVLQGFGSGMIS